MLRTATICALGPGNCFSPSRSRLVDERSTRRLCRAVNSCDEASATATTRSTAANLFHDVHAATTRLTTTTAARNPITDLSRALTVSRLNMQMTTTFGDNCMLEPQAQGFDQRRDSKDADAARSVERN